MPDWLMTLLVGLSIAGLTSSVGALIGIGKLLQRVKSLETAHEEMKILHSGAAHRSPDWEGEVRRRLESIDSAVDRLRARSEADREWLIKKMGEIQVELARIGNAQK